MHVEGPHRFLTIAGKTGFHPTSVKTVARIDTEAHAAERGTLVLSVAPLESLGVAARQEHFTRLQPDAQKYGLIADALPVNDEKASTSTLR